jgi:hypothetical protein
MIIESENCFATSTCPVIWGISGSETSSKFAEEILFPEER